MMLPASAIILCFSLKGSDHTTLLPPNTGTRRATLCIYSQQRAVYIIISDHKQIYIIFNLWRISITVTVFVSPHLRHNWNVYQHSYQNQLLTHSLDAKIPNKSNHLKDLMIFWKDQLSDKWWFNNLITFNKLLTTWYWREALIYIT